MFSSSSLGPKLFLAIFGLGVEFSAGIFFFHKRKFFAHKWRPQCFSLSTASFCFFLSAYLFALEFAELPCALGAAISAMATPMIIAPLMGRVKYFSLRCQGESSSSADLKARKFFLFSISSCLAMAAVQFSLILNGPAEFTENSASNAACPIFGHWRYWLSSAVVLLFLSLSCLFHLNVSLGQAADSHEVRLELNSLLTMTSLASLLYIIIIPADFHAGESAVLHGSWLFYSFLYFLLSHVFPSLWFFYGHRELSRNLVAQKSSVVSELALVSRRASINNSSLLLINSIKNIDLSLRSRLLFSNINLNNNSTLYNASTTGQVGSPLSKSSNSFSTGPQSPRSLLNTPANGMDLLSPSSNMHIDTDFLLLLTAPQYFFLFDKFATRALCTENLKFWSALEEFKFNLIHLIHNWREENKKIVSKFESSGNQRNSSAQGESCLKEGETPVLGPTAEPVEPKTPDHLKVKIPEVKLDIATPQPEILRTQEPAEAKAERSESTQAPTAPLDSIAESGQILQPALSHSESATRRPSVSADGEGSNTPSSNSTFTETPTSPLSPIASGPPPPSDAVLSIFSHPTSPGRKAYRASRSASLLQSRRASLDVSTQIIPERDETAALAAEEAEEGKSEEKALPKGEGEVGQAIAITIRNDSESRSVAHGDSTPRQVVSSPRDSHSGVFSFRQTPRNKNIRRYSLSGHEGRSPDRRSNGRRFSWVFDAADSLVNNPALSDLCLVDLRPAVHDSCLRIYESFIRPLAAFEINISSATRKALILMFEVQFLQRVDLRRQKGDVLPIADASTVPLLVPKEFPSAQFHHNFPLTPRKWSLPARRASLGTGIQLGLSSFAPLPPLEIRPEPLADRAVVTLTTASTVTGNSSNPTSNVTSRNSFMNMNNTPDTTAPTSPEPFSPVEIQTGENAQNTPVNGHRATAAPVDSELSKEKTRSLEPSSSSSEPLLDSYSEEFSSLDLIGLLNVFSRVEQEVFRLMKNDLYPRFLQAPEFLLFKQMKENEKEKEKL